MVNFGYNNNEIFSKGKDINIKSAYELENILSDSTNIILKLKSDEIFEGPIEEDFDNKWKDSIKSFSSNTIYTLLLLAKFYPNAEENYNRADKDNSKKIGGA